MGSQRRRFDEEFKKEAVRMAYESGRTVADVARELDLRPDLLRRWRNKIENPGKGQSEDSKQIRRLQRELSRTREERDILKKALAIFSDQRR